MTDHPYRNTTSQAEREAVLRNDVRVNTLHGRAQLELQQLAQGRFARSNTVIAGEGAPTYPAAADWTQDHLPPEEPLGLDISAVEPVGEPWEIRKSIRRAAIAATPPEQQRGDSAGVVANRSNDAGAEVGSLVPTDLGLPASPKPKIWRRPI